MNIKDIAHANRELEKLYTFVRQRGPDGHALDRMWPLLKVVGNPQERIQVVHVAGTSGKTSTSYYIAALLHSFGAKVGLTVSPHVDSVTERIQIDGSPIDEDVFCSEFGAFLDHVYAMEDTPSYFEVLISFAFWFFEKRGVDYVVAETGMGGLLDSTNVVTRADKVCVITDIGMDHMHILGDTIESIAKQKAGIIQQSNEVFMIEQDKEVMHVIQQWAEGKQAKINVLSDNDVERNLNTKHVNTPLFQLRNWSLALRASIFVAQRDGLKISSNISPNDVVVPGRMEMLLLNDGSTLIMDGAHNGQKIATFIDSFQHLYPDQKAHVLLALKEGKEHTEVVEHLAPIIEDAIVTSFEDKQDFHIVSQDPDPIIRELTEKDIVTERIDDISQAYEALTKKSGRIKLIIGSIYLLSQIRKLTKS